MARTSTVFARVEPDVKERAERILNNLGLSLSNAVDIYLRQIIMQKGIPFDVRMSINEPVALQSLAKEEFDAEIIKGLDDIKKGRTFAAEDVRKEIERDYGI